MRSRVTIRDVAERAGCSVSTVSRVLNGTGRVGADTRARVHEAAAVLAFRFDPVGQSLRSRRSRTLGALVPTLANPVFADAIEGVQSVARGAGYQLLLSSTDYAPEEEAAAVSTLLAHRVDGVILTVSDSAASPALDIVLEAGVPFVLVFNQPAQDLPAVAFDNAAAAADVARAMRARGHRETAFVAGRFRSSDRSKQRYLGFRDAWRAMGGPDPHLIEVDYTGRSHCQALARILARHPGLTAFFCSNDMLALRVIADLRELGWGVPQDLSVVGFDGIDVAAMSQPTLATIETPSVRMGAEAAERVIREIETRGEPEDGLTLLSHAFRPGQSLGPAPGGTAGDDAATSSPVTVPETQSTETIP